MYFGNFFVFLKVLELNKIYIMIMLKTYFYIIIIIIII